MSNFEAIVLGIIQGLTEFLPISSSGHLEIGKALFDLGFKTPHGKPLDQKQIYRLCNS